MCLCLCFSRISLGPFYQKKYIQKWGLRKKRYKGVWPYRGVSRREGSNILHTMPMKASSKFSQKLPSLKRSRCDNDVDHFQIENWFLLYYNYLGIIALNRNKLLKCQLLCNLS